MIKNILILTQITLKEAFSRKIFIAFAGISTFVLLLFTVLSLTVGLDDFGAAFKVENSDMVFSNGIADLIKILIVSPLFAGGLFLAIFSASSFIPHMLEKGNIDILLSKPVARWQIILGKYIGGNIVVLLNIAYLVAGIWVLVGLKFGVWDAAFLLTIFSITFAFATLYALIILIGILSKSSVLAMMVSYLIIIIISPVLNARDAINAILENGTVEIILDLLYYITPKTSEIWSVTSELSRGFGISDYQPITTSLLFIILTLYLSIFTFNKKDY